MKHLIIKIVIFFSLILMSFLYLSTKRSYHLVKKITSRQSEYEVINLGNSHGANIAYIGVNGNGFTRGGNTLFYDLQNYKYLKDRLKAEAVVIIPISYFSFGLDENRTDRKDSDAFVNMYYMYLPSSSIHDYSFNKKIQVYLNFIKGNYHSVIDERFSLNKPKIKDSIAKEVKIERDAEEQANIHKQLALYSSAEKNVIYLNSILELIINNGHKPVLLTMPYSDNYNSKFDKTWLEHHYFRYINETVKKYNVPYLNYSEDERISTKDSLFRDSHHLNNKGRIYFSKILIDDLRKAQVLKNKI